MAFHLHNGQLSDHTERYKDTGLSPEFLGEIAKAVKGVVMHLLGKVDPDLVPQDEYEGFISPEVHERMMAENPLNLHARQVLSINDIWMPVQNWNVESKWLVRVMITHTGLNKLSELLSLTPIQNPYTYTHIIGQVLDCSKIIRKEA